MELLLIGYFFSFLLLTGRSYGAFWDLLFYVFFLLTGRSYGAFWDLLFYVFFPTDRALLWSVYKWVASFFF